MTRVQFVADHQVPFGAKRMRQVIRVAKSSYYAWVRTAERRAWRAADAKLARRIRMVQYPVSGDPA